MKHYPAEFKADAVALSGVKARMEVPPMPGQHDATLPDSVLRILHVRCPADVDPQVYRLLLGLVAEVTPVVQALPPSALVADVSGSLRYFGRDLPAWPG
ncbi:hypothetical protein [Streptomyces cyaneofuscatus]|uniref:hypothetical protein n=1 Tax=Streptomyces cyaneofuscatus TaxID=66883 RepID=UPI0036562CE4